MPTQGLSLVGFMEQQPAIDYLGNICIPTNPSPPALISEWTDAKAKLGPAFSDAGQPTVSVIPPSQVLQDIQNAAWLSPFFQQGWEPRLVEPLDLLLAFQVHIDLNRSSDLCSGLPANPSEADALSLCLPTNPPLIPPVFPSGHPDRSFIFKSPSLDFRIQGKGYFPPPTNMAGIQLGMGASFAQVVRFNGRCYLRNGFHRAHGLLSRNFKQLPCLYREVSDFKDVAEGPPATFGQALLESANPPTLGHFTTARARAVTLRRFSRVIHIGWEEYVVPED